MTTTILVLEGCIIAVWPLLGVWWAYRKVRARFSPKYALKLKAKEKERSDRAARKRGQRRVAKEARLAKWAEEHPEDPHAKALLAAGSSLASTVSALADVAVGVAETERDFVAELRRSQKSADDYKRRREAEKVAEELHAQQLLDWSIENPTIPEARRHLGEQLDEATKRLGYVESDVRHCQTMMSYGREEDDPESILYATRLSDAQAKKAFEEELIRRIQTALEAPLPESSEQ